MHIYINHIMNNQITLFFSKFQIPLSQVFLVRKNVFGMVNLKPFLPGHVLVIPKRVVLKFEDLSEEETLQLFTTAHQVCQKLGKLNGQYEVILQNGKEAGQTVPHLHLHLIPKLRNTGLERQNDQPRSQNVMAQQASKYRIFFQPFTV